MPELKEDCFKDCSQKKSMGSTSNADPFTFIVRGESIRHHQSNHCEYNIKVLFIICFILSRHNSVRENFMAMAYFFNISCLGSLTQSHNYFSTVLRPITHVYFSLKYGSTESL